MISAPVLKEKKRVKVACMTTDFAMQVRSKGRSPKQK